MTFMRRDILAHMAFVPPARRLLRARELELAVSG
jgi:hypothetical protein